MDAITFGKINELSFTGAEAYKSLRTNIAFCGSDIKVLTFTSCTPNEGKSSVSFHLAASFAQNGKKVILVDADIRKSVLVGRLKVKEETLGLSHYLSGQSPLEETIYETNVSNMDIILSGPVVPNPSELLGGSRFAEMVEILRKVYDYVIIDTPPLGSVIDSAIVAKISDGAVLVIESGVISYKFAQNVKKQLEKSQCHIIGAILNKVEMNSKSYYGNYYGKYYGRYYGRYGKED